MRTRFLSWVGALAAGVMLGATGCSSLSSETIQYLGVPARPPRDWTTVTLLREMPRRPHEKLGEVVLSASLDPAPKVEKIETLLRKKAAALGADAVVLRRDQVEVTGSWVSGPYWSPLITPVRSRVIVGVAIRYTD
jgi:hypothetical protein